MKVIFLDSKCKANAMACVDVQVFHTCIGAVYVGVGAVWAWHFEVAYHGFKLADRSVFSSAMCIAFTHLSYTGCLLCQEYLHKEATYTISTFLT